MCVSPSMSWLRMDSDGLNSAGQIADRKVWKVRAVLP